MTSARENEVLTRVGPGTPLGELMRRYWIPAAMSSELAADGDPMRLRLLGENLIGFRDTGGRVGVMDHRCPHRCASLFFGRNEEGGIRCVYHGWKFDTDGNCLDMANVPPHQDFRQKVKAKAYKAAERNGLVWVFMGDQERVPALPDIEATLLPESERSISFTLRECNWMQGVEGELDTSHVGFLHYGAVKSEDLAPEDYQTRTAGNRTPEYVVEETEFGLLYGAYRPAEDGMTYWRVAPFIFPFWTMNPSNPIEHNILARAYVPLDDDNTMQIILMKHDADRRDRAAIAGRIAGTRRGQDYLPHTTDWLGRFRLAANASNDYRIDREVQRSESFTGIEGIPLQDQAVQESMGAIVDRTLEHLAPSDVAITRMRRRVYRAATALAKDGTPPPGAERPDCVAHVRAGHFLAPEGADWRAAYEERLSAAPLVIAAE